MKWVMLLAIVVTILSLVKGCTGDKCNKYGERRVYIEEYTYFMPIGNMMMPMTGGGYWTTKEVCVENYNTYKDEI